MNGKHIQKQIVPDVNYKFITSPDGIILYNNIIASFTEEQRIDISIYEINETSPTL